jgi:ribosomal protein S18 acetylase RimI-like enzyme
MKRNPMDIRPAQLTDLIGIQTCASAAYGKYIGRIGRRPAPMIADFEAQIREGTVHVIAHGNAIVGYAVFYPRGNHFHLESVAVDPVHQGMGYGIKLIKFVEQRAAGSGAEAVELYTNAKMTENLTLYPRLGYVETCRRHEGGFDRVFFRKAIEAKTED